jgi:hypothetical protein
LPGLDVREGSDSDARERAPLVEVSHGSVGSAVVVEMRVQRVEAAVRFEIWPNEIRIK